MASPSILSIDLVSHPDLQFLGASLVGAVYDPESEEKFGGVEIECPFSAFQRDLSPLEAVSELGGCEAACASLVLKKIHHYFFQVQGQMAISGLPWVDFVVWTDLDKVSVQRIYPDKMFWHSCMLTVPSRLFMDHHAATHSSSSESST